MSATPPCARRYFFAAQLDATAPARPDGAVRPGRTARPVGSVSVPPPACPAPAARPLNVAQALRALAIALAALIAAAMLGWWETRPDRPYRLPPPVGERTLRQPLAIQLVIDESGSNATSDPRGLRNSESAEVIRWLSRHGRPADHLGVVQFATEPLTTLPLMPVRHGVSRARSATAPDMRVAGGGTNIASALALALSNLAEAPAQSRRMIILFTDGASDTEGSIAPVLAEASGIDVVMIALDADGTYTQSREFWEALPLRGITRVESAGRGAVARPIAEAILNETGQRLP
jgi:hypothetical protein